MNHPHEDQLLLLAYGELRDADVVATEAHLAQCATCRAELGRLERARVALDSSLTVSRRRTAPWIALGLAAAAVLALVVLSRPDTPADAERGWRPPAVWSATGGYIAGGATVVQIDAQLTRLEKERYYDFQD